MGPSRPAGAGSEFGEARVDDKAKILLVDDREENLIALEAILSSLDQDLVRARSGEDALKALLTDEYAVILLDVVMPGMDGFETARDIKRRKKTRDLPIIFLTAVNSDPDYAFRGYAAGAVDFISKPFDPWVLRAKVSVFVELHTKNKQLRDQTALLREQAALLREQQNLLSERSGAGSPVPALDRLAAVEEQAEVVGKHLPAARRDEYDELARRLAELRSALDGAEPPAS
ncbi:Response regulator receiver domain-containing protein [Actinomadura meyerae]|uniref:Response regulator receiver domain-containing protein n=1 Tax=Actinomadura meyerae TaxID=240840 RepID=A0A239MV09_9ACTN|nr:Response regulator receiver domain-containing protein [Actinomadura meyerae]